APYLPPPQAPAAGTFPHSVGDKGRRVYSELRPNGLRDRDVQAWRPASGLHQGHGRGEDRLSPPSDRHQQEVVMKALVYHGPGNKAWEEVPDPQIQTPTDAIVQIDTTTICGTDLHI